MSLFSYLVSKESKTCTLIENLRKMWGTKSFRKSTPTKVINAVAEKANLRSRAPKVAEFSDFSWLQLPMYLQESRTLT